MDNTSTIAIIALSVTTVTSVALVLVQLILQQRHTRRDARARLVSDMIDAMERATRPFAKPALLRPWARPEVEFLLAVPRLMLNLDRDDTVIGHWAMAQTQAMQAAASDKKAVGIGITIAVRLTEWHQGDRSRRWFADALAANPLRPAGTVPAAATLRRTVSQTSQMLLGVFMLVAAVAPGVVVLALPVGPRRGSSRHR